MEVIASRKLPTANNKLMIKEVMSFVCSDLCEKGITRQKQLSKSASKMLRQINFFRICMVPKQCTGIFHVKCIDKTCGTRWWKKTLESRQNSKKGFEKNELACTVEGIFLVSYSTCSQYLKAVPARKNQSSSKLWQFKESDKQKTHSRG